MRGDQAAPAMTLRHPALIIILCFQKMRAIGCWKQIGCSFVAPKVPHRLTIKPQFAENGALMRDLAIKCDGLGYH